jgi:hypothetical protein
MVVRKLQAFTGFFYYFMFMLSSIRWQDVICSAEASRSLFTLLLCLYNCPATGALDIKRGQITLTGLIPSRQCLYFLLLYFL